jgi:hypothetical protein
VAPDRQKRLPGKARDHRDLIKDREPVPFGRSGRIKKIHRGNMMVEPMEEYESFENFLEDLVNINESCGHPEKEPLG